MNKQKPGALTLPKPVIDAWYEALVAATKPSKQLEKIQGNREALLEHLWSFEGENVIQLWQTFNTDRGQLPRYLQNPHRQRMAYLLGFHLPNVARTTWLLRQALGRLKLGAFSHPLSLHDLGAGTGAAAIGAKLALGDALKAIKLYDHQPLFLESARLGLATAFNVDAQWDAGNLFHQLPKLRLDEANLNMISLSYVYNEVSTNDALVKRLLQTLAWSAQHPAPTILVLAEAASQNQARATMALRDELVGQGWLPVYPCPHVNECPLLQRSRDWCYSEGRWCPPDAQASIDEALDIDRSSFALAGYVFVNAATSIQPQWPPAVVVGRPKETRSKRPEFKYLLCNSTGEASKSRTAFPVRPPFKMRGQPYINS